MFEDIADSSYKADIEWLVAEGITTGCSPTRFCPTALVTREQMATFLVRMFDLPSTTKDYFTDDATSTHEVDINRLAAAGVTTGCSATKYCPKRVVSRGQMASFISKAAKLTDYGANYYYDDIHSIHSIGIERITAAGITRGCWIKRYCLVAGVPREQMAAYLHRVIAPIDPLPLETWYEGLSHECPQYSQLDWDWTGPPYRLFVQEAPCTIAHSNYQVWLTVFGPDDAVVARWTATGPFTDMALGGGWLDVKKGMYTVIWNDISYGKANMDWPFYINVGGPQPPGCGEGC